MPTLPFYFLFLPWSFYTATLIKTQILYQPCILHCLNFFVAYSRTLPEKAMAPHSSTLAWKIPWTEEPGGMQSMGSLRVGHDWANSLSLSTFMHWRRKWQPSVLAWRIPGIGEPGGLLSMGSHGVGHEWSDLAAAAALHWQADSYLLYP